MFDPQRGRMYIINNLATNMRPRWGRTTVSIKFVPVCKYAINRVSNIQNRRDIYLNVSTNYLKKKLPHNGVAFIFSIN